MSRDLSSVRPRSLGWATDLAVLAPSATFEARDGHLVVRTPGNPGYYWGNFLLFPAAPGPGDLARWEAAFTAAFGHEPRVRHTTFGWDDPAGTEGAIAEFVAAGYEPYASVVLSAGVDDLRRPPRHADDVVVRPLASDADWAQALVNQVACREDGHAEAAYLPFKRAQMAAHREAMEAGHGRWYGAFRGDRLVADCGLYVQDGLARFQAVGVAPDARRQGVCGALVLAVARDGVEALGARTLVMAAEPDAPAEGIYRAIGFRPTERQLGVCRWPR